MTGRAFLIDFRTDTCIEQCLHLFAIFAVTSMSRMYTGVLGRTASCMRQQGGHVAGDGSQMTAATGWMDLPMTEDGLSSLMFDSSFQVLDVPIGYLNPNLNYC